LYLIKEFLVFHNERKGRKMKRIISIMAILCLLLAQVAFAQPPSGPQAKFVEPSNPIEKLQRGFLNLADAVVEVPGTMMRKTDTDGPFVGLTWGMVQGVLHTVKRAFTGAYEIGTFLIPIPAEYGPILKDPPFLSKE